jgi:hypothetical protein
MHMWKVVLSSVMIGAFGAAAVAQDAPTKEQPPARSGQPRGQRPAQLSPEKAKAAWEVEAKGVAKRLGLNDAQTTALVKAYTDSRTSQNEAFDKARKEAQDKAGDENADRRTMGREALAKLDEINTAEKAKLEKALTAGGLSSDQASKAVTSLGTYNRQWDNMADTVSGFGLEAGKQQDALNAIEEYVVSASKARSAMSGGGDRESAMTQMRDAREKLTTSMKKVLSDDQFQKFEATMGPGGRGPGGQGGDNPRPRRGGDSSGGGEGRRPGGGGR